MHISWIQYKGWAPGGDKTIFGLVEIRFIICMYNIVSISYTYILSKYLLYKYVYNIFLSNMKIIDKKIECKKVIF